MFSLLLLHPLLCSSFALLFAAAAFAVVAAAAAFAAFAGVAVAAAAVAAATGILVRWLLFGR